MTGVPDRGELLEILGARARAGNVAAVKALLDELRREDDDSDAGSGFDALDELASRRDRKTAGA